MFRDAIAWLFRALNSYLTGTRGVVFKLLKVVHWKSRLFYKYWGYPKSRWIVIRNFDHDIQMRLDPSRPIGGAIYWTGFHEFREMIFLHHYLKPEMVLVDVGANLGEFTLFAAKRLRRGQVIAYEPLPGMIDVLLKDIVLNNFSNVTLVPCGLSDTARSVPLFTPASADDNEGLATLFPEDGATGSVMIDLRTLDQEAEKLKLERLDVITMDIEGAELFALRGAIQSLKQFRPLVIIEINQKTFAAAGYSPESVFDFFKELQYASFELNKQGDLVPLAGVPHFANVIFKPLV